MLRQIQNDLPALAWLQIDVVEQRAGGEAAVVMYALTSGVTRQPVARRVRGECDCAERSRWRTRIDRRLAIDTDQIVLEHKILDRAHAACGIQKLRGRIDLERPHDERQRYLLAARRRIVQPVDAVQVAAADGTARVRRG